jgi:hypothetical protein
MGRKKDLVPEVRHGRALLVGRGRWVKTVNEEIVPPLLVGWRSKVHAIENLSSEHWDIVEAAVTHYVAERAARVQNPIEWKETIARIERIANSAKVLLDELNDWRGGYNLIWHRLEEISAQSRRAPLRHDDVYPIASNLYATAATAAIQVKAEWKMRGSLSYKEPWNRLIWGLADLWRQTGSNPTAANSVRGGYAKPSDFVQFVWDIIQTAVPKPLVEHTSSKGAMQGAINKALRMNEERRKKRDH